MARNVEHHLIRLRWETVVILDLIIKEAREQVSVIQSDLKTTQSHQKTYVDKQKKSLQFEVGDHVYLKVSPMRGVHRFGV